MTVIIVLGIMSLVSAPLHAVAANSRKAKIDISSYPAKPWPFGMVWIPGGSFVMGGQGTSARADEYPVHTVRVDGFWMDKTEVTNDEFAKFVADTGYVTTAERKPNRDELKRQLPEGTAIPSDDQLKPGSLVFTPTNAPVSLEDYRQWWKWSEGASWKCPSGPKSSIKGKGAFPVVHVSYTDAAAYCKWAHKRLPTEAEWEFAARGGTEGQPYASGCEMPSHKQINSWQGAFPYKNTAKDGYALAAPVTTYPANAYGVYEIIGNVWEWCHDWYRSDYYKELLSSHPGTVVNPQGPESGYDAQQPTGPKRVQRGGSFLCNEQFCSSYRPSARMCSSPDTSAQHVGFRCVMSDAEWREASAKETGVSK